MLNKLRGGDRQESDGLKLRAIDVFYFWHWYFQSYFSENEAHSVAYYTVAGLSVMVLGGMLLCIEGLAETVSTGTDSPAGIFMIICAGIALCIPKLLFGSIERREALVQALQKKQPSKLSALVTLCVSILPVIFLMWSFDFLIYRVD